MDGYVLSDSGVKVWTAPEAHPLLRHTDTAHPAFREKLAETYSRGKVKGLPRVLSENSEDACTWYYFSPLLHDESGKARVLTNLLTQSFPDDVLSQVLKAAPKAEVEFWPKLLPPPCRPQKEGPSEPDVVVKIGREALLLVEAKYRSDVSERTTYDARPRPGDTPDRRRFMARATGALRTLLLDRAAVRRRPTNAERIVGRYAGQPEAIRRALPYQSDLTAADYGRLLARWRLRGGRTRLKLPADPSSAAAAMPTPASCGR